MSFMRPWKPCIAKRYIFVVIAHFACFMIYAHRFNFSVSLVAMVRKTEPKSHLNNTSKECHQAQPISNVSTSNPANSMEEGEFTWSEKDQGLLKSAFFHGYTWTLLLGGIISSKVSCKWTFGVGIFAQSTLTLLIPAAARTNFYLLYTVRFLIGFCQGLSSPAVQEVLKEWAPMNEKARLSAIVYSGSETGSVASLILGGVICSYFGWPAFSYALGAAGIVLCAVWMSFVSDSPKDHPTISAEEKSYIIKSQCEQDTPIDTIRPAVPWRAILLSGPVWAISIAKLSHNWIKYLAIDDTPSYFKDVMNMRTIENGFLSGIPFIFSFFMQLLSAVICDYSIKKGCSVTTTRKVVLSLAFTSSAIMLSLVGYVGCESEWLSVVCITLLVGTANFSYSGYGVNQLDIAPRFAGVIWSINSFVGNISGVVTGLVTGYVTNNHPTRYYYRIVFMIAAGVSMFGVVFYCVFGSGKEQQWNKVGTQNQEQAPEKGCLKGFAILRKCQIKRFFGSCRSYVRFSDSQFPVSIS